MKYCFCSLILLTISVLVHGQNSAIVTYDSTSNFKGDLPVGAFQKGNGIILLKIKSNDSTFLYKEYSKNKLLNAYQCDLTGFLNGYSYFLDTINQYVTKGFSSKGKTIYSYTLNRNLDTLRYTRKTNDTLYDCMEIKNGVKKMWQLDSNFIYNGYYKTFNLSTNKIISEGHYMAIKKSNIKDNKKYTALLKKYNLDYKFRGEIDLMAEIPVGVWYYYNENGKLEKSVKYDWKGVFTL